MPNLIETGLADLLKATTDNTQFLAKISRSIQLEQGEKAPQAARFYEFIGISGQSFNVPHPTSYIENIQILASSANTGYIFVADQMAFDVSQIEQYLNIISGTDTTNGNVIFPFKAIAAGEDVNIKTNQTLNIFPYSTGSNPILSASIIVTYYNTLSHHTEQDIVEESMRTLRFNPEQPLRG